EEVGLARRQLVGRMLAGRDRHRDRAAAAGALDVERGIPDDRDAVEREVVAERASPLPGDGRQQTTVGVVAAVGGYPAERPQPRRGQLDPGAGLDVPGQKPDDGVVALAETPDDCVDPRQYPHPRAVADLDGELARVGLEARVEAGPDTLDLQPRRRHEL